MKTVTEALNYRRAVRVYDSEKPISEVEVKTCIKEATLAPSSSNMQLWEFYHVTSKDVISKLAVASYSQKAVKTAEQLVVVVVRKDLWRKRVKSNLDFLVHENSKHNRPPYYEKTMPFIYSEFFGIWGVIKSLVGWTIGLFKPAYRQLSRADMRIVAHKSAALAAQTFMLSMASRSLDTCPIEGFDSKRVKKILKLPYSSEVNMIISCGKRSPKGVYGERFRIPFEEVYFKI